MPGDRKNCNKLALELTCEQRIRAGWWDSDGLQLLGLGEDPKLRDLKGLLRRADNRRRAEIVSHRPGKRAVLRLETPHEDEFTGTGSDKVEFIKVVSAGKAAKILDGIRWATAFTDAFRTPKVLNHSDSTVTFAELEGTSLHEPESLGAEQWAQAWTEVCHALSETVSTAHCAARSAPVHGAESEAGVLRRWFQLTAEYLPDAEQTLRSVTTLSAQLTQLTEDRLVPAHRDLHDKQLLWSPRSGPGLLDVDTACLADPALDLGNLRAHSLLRRLQGLWSAQDAETVRLRLDEAAERCVVASDSIAVYERAALMRLGMVYAVRPQYADVAAELRQSV